MGLNIYIIGIKKKQFSLIPIFVWQKGGNSMKKFKLDNQVKLTGLKNFRGEDKIIDYYLVLPKEQERMYAFSKMYTQATYDLCKSGIRVNDLIIT